MSNITKTFLKKSIGVVFIIIGLLALLTPLTPGGLLFFVGLELLGLRLVFQAKILVLWRWLKNRVK